MKSNVNHIILVSVLLLSFWLKLTVWSAVLKIDPANFLSPDSASYIDGARAMLYTGTFAVSPDDPTVLQYQRTPGFPLFVSGVFLAFGEQQPIVVLMLILLSLVTICLTYRIALALYKPNIASLAALLLAFDVVSFSYSLKFLTETLFTFFVVAILFCGIQIIKSGGQKWWFLGMGLTLTATTFVRPISYYLIVPLALGLLIWLMLQRVTWRKTALNLLLLVLPFIILVGMWQARNYTYLGNSQFSGISGANLFFYRATAVVALRDGITFGEAQEKLYETIAQNISAERQGEVDRVLMQQGIEIIIQHPLLFIQTQIQGAIPLLLGGGEGPVLRMLNVPMGRTLDRDIFDALTNFDLVVLFRRFTTGISLIAFGLALAYLGTVYLGVLAGWGQSLIRREITVRHLFLVGVLVYFVFISAGPEANSRFRVPVMPILVVFSAPGLILLWQTVRQRFFSRAVNESKE